MKKTRKLAVLAGAAVAPIIAISLPAASADAHGYISSPPSRPAQCYNHVVSCGQIQYEPWSVEAPKGGTTCSGGNTRFPDLNDNSKPWVYTNVGRSVTFTWTIQANHATASWQYFILGGQKIAQFDDGGKQPPTTLSHTVTVPQSGHVTILAVWNVYDTPNAFYNCIDLNVQ